MIAGKQTTLLSNATSVDVCKDPYPHIALDDALPADYYAALEEAFPTYSTIMRGRTDDLGNAAARLPFKFATQSRGIAEIWRDFFEVHVSAAFWRDIVRVFHDDLKRIYPDLEREMGLAFAQWQPTPRGTDQHAALELDCQFVINTPGKVISSVKTCHVDRETTIFSALYYMRAAEDNSVGGDLELYRWKREPRFFGSRQALPMDVEVTRSIPYRPNALAGFINQPRSIHGVSPREPSPWPRRYINLIATVPRAAFQLPQISLMTKLFSGSEMRRQMHRSVGGDKY
jgi:hypothetical protein